MDHDQQGPAPPQGPPGGGSPEGGPPGGGPPGEGPPGGGPPGGGPPGGGPPGLFGPRGPLPEWIPAEDRRRKELNLGKPEPFTGDRTKVKRFLQKCQLYILLNKDVYDDNGLRIGLILSLMTKGEAADWAEQFIDDIANPTTGALEFPSYQNFANLLLRDFKQEDQVRDTANKLKYLKQGNRERQLRGRNNQRR